MTQSAPITTEIILTLHQLPGVGNKTIFKIADDVKTPITTLKELCDYWPSMKGKKLQAITNDDLKKAYQIARQIIYRGLPEGIGVISYFDLTYPEILRSCMTEDGKPDPPLILYWRGNLKALEMPGVAVIGTREPTPNGEKAGLYFAGEFAKRGYNIVSGLAIGCDTTGHKGALAVGGTTTAFLANGLDWNSIYPKENLELAKEIVEKGGLLLSEYPIGQPCGRYGLVARDRLQAGLSKATIVVQTGKKGGTMHAVNATLASNKPLFVVEYKHPSDFNHEKVQGNLFLQQEKGALPLRSSDIENAVSIIEGRSDHPHSFIQPSLFD